MRLRDLDAQWIYDATPNARRTCYHASVVGAQGILFQCPKCAEACEMGEEDGRRFARGAHYIAVFFANPQGAPVAPHEADHNPRWTMSGTSVDDLTLSPSVNLDTGPDGGCRWHGFVTNGEAQ
jgi:hypothetical protein